MRLGKWGRGEANLRLPQRVPKFALKTNFLLTHRATNLFATRLPRSRFYLSRRCQRPVDRVSRDLSGTRKCQYAEGVIAISRRSSEANTAG